MFRCILALSLIVAGGASGCASPRAAMTVQTEAPQSPAPAPSPQKRDPLTFGFWNVENLFDAEDDPTNPGDDEYLPANGWTDTLYRVKLDRLAQVIAAVAPHALGVAEVENRTVLSDLVAHPSLAHLALRIAHLDSPDKRGIDVALLYRPPFTITEGTQPQLIPFEREGQLGTRGVLRVDLQAEGRPLTVLVNHWPSRGGDRDGAFRAVAGAVVRGIVDEVGHDHDIIVVGDLNDDPYDPSVRQHLGAIRSRNAVENRTNQDALFNPSWSLLGKTDQGTLYYNREWVWSVFDQIIVSRGMINPKGFAWVDGSFEIYAPDELRDQYRRPIRFRRRAGDDQGEGHSDHFLVHGQLVLEAQREPR